MSLATKKHDGSWVWTPVWFAYSDDGSQLYCFSAGDAGKVKRLRNYSEIQVKPCTSTGKPLGESSLGEGWLINSDEQCRSIHLQLRQKYGWQLRLLDFFSRLSGNFNKRQFIGCRTK